MTAREAFGPTLQQQRQRRGVTLESIAQTTKISKSQLAALERSDVSKWPGGIYRRSYFREYAAAIGLPPEPALLEFLRLFPEPGASIACVEDESGPLRLSLVPESRWKTPARNALAALLDGGAVLLLGYTLATGLGTSLWTMTAAAGLAAHAIGTAMLGKSFGMWCVTSGVFSRRAAPASPMTEIGLLRRDWLSGFLEPTKTGSRDSSFEPSM